MCLLRLGLSIASTLIVSLEQQPTDRYAASVMKGLPVSAVLNCGIELWRNLELDDDELLEIAIRDISYHIQLHKNEQIEYDSDKKEELQAEKKREADLESHTSEIETKSSSSSPFDTSYRRFNPRIDPTVLFLEIKRLTLNLDNFFFRIEKTPRKTIFDPVFEGRGMLSLQNISIRLRVECAKERVNTSQQGTGVLSPILQLRDLSVNLDELQMTVKDTGFGSDWVLNKAVEVFEEQIREQIQTNLREQIREQIQNVIENLNSYFLMNPGFLFNVLGITMDDLEDNVVWV